MSKKTVPEFGASKSAKVLLDGFYPKIQESVGSLLRYFGWLIAIGVIYMQLGFDGLRIEPGEFRSWLVLYFVYLVILEILRKIQFKFYDSRDFRFLRVLINVLFISFLLSITSNLKEIIGFLYLIPIWSTLVYFSGNLFIETFVIIAAFCGLYLGGITLAQTNPIALPQYIFIALALLLSNLVFKRTFLRPNYMSGVARELHRLLDLTDLMKRIVEIGVEVSGADRAIIIVIDQRTQKYIGHLLHNFQIKEGMHFGDLIQRCYVIRENKPFISDDLAGDKDQTSIFSEFFKAQPKSIVSVPITDRTGNLTGVFCITHDFPNTFDYLSKELIGELIAIAGTSIEDSLMFRKAKLQEAQNRQHSLEFAGATTVGQMANTVTRVALDKIEGAKKSSIVLNGFGQSLLRMRVQPQEGNMLTDMEVALEQSLIEMTKGSRDPALINDLRNYPPLSRTTIPETIGAALIAPIIHPTSGRAYGTINLYSDKVGKFNSDDEAAIFGLATQAALNLEKLENSMEVKNHGSVIKRISDEFTKLDLSVDLNSVCRQITDIGLNSLGFKVARIRILNGESDQFEVAATSAEGYLEEKPSTNSGIPQRIILDLFNDNYRAGRSYYYPQETLGRELAEAYFSIPVTGVQSGLNGNAWDPYNLFITPLASQDGSLLGVLTLDVPKGDQLLSDYMLEAVGVFAQAAAWAIENHQFRSGLEEKKRRVVAFIESLSDVLSQNEGKATTVGEIVVKVGAELIGAEGCSLHLLDLKESKIWLAYSTFLSNTTYIGRKKHLKLRKGCGLSTWVGITGQPLLFNNSTYESHVAWAREKEQLRHLASGKTSSLMLVPVFDPKSKVIGVLTLENKKRFNRVVEFNDEDQKMLEMLAKQFAITREVADREQTKRYWERKNLEDDLHDLIGWYHGGVVLELDTLAETLSETNNFDASLAFLEEIRSRALTTVDELKSIHTAVFTKIFEAEKISDGFARLRNAWIDRAPSVDLENKLNIECPPSVQLPAPLKNTYLRITFGSISNAIKYSGIKTDPKVVINVNLYKNADLIVLTISDNGKGVERILEGYGMKRMKTLVRELNTTLANSKTKIDFISVPNSGMKVSVTTRLSL